MPSFPSYHWLFLWSWFVLSNLYLLKLKTTLEQQLNLITMWSYHWSSISEINACSVFGGFGYTRYSKTAPRAIARFAQPKGRGIVKNLYLLHENGSNYVIFGPIHLISIAYGHPYSRAQTQTQPQSQLGADDDDDTDDHPELKPISIKWNDFLTSANVF